VNDDKALAIYQAYGDHPIFAIFETVVPPRKHVILENKSGIEHIYAVLGAVAECVGIWRRSLR